MRFGSRVPFKVMRDVCYYDGACGICRGSARRLEKLDWLGRLEFRDMLQTPEGELPVSFADAMKGMPMHTGDGRVLVGYPAIRRALRQTPLGMPIALVLYIPGISAIGKLAYEWVAAHRPRSGACRVDLSPGPGGASTEAAGRTRP